MFEAGPHGVAESQQRGLSDLVHELFARPTNQGERTIDERRMRDAEVDHRVSEMFKSVDRRGHLGCCGAERFAQLAKIGNDDFGEQFFLAGEVPVDDRAVDTDGPCDVFDLSIARAGFIKQCAGRCQDLLAAPQTASRTCSSTGRLHVGHRRGNY